MRFIPRPPLGLLDNLAKELSRFLDIRVVTEELKVITADWSPNVNIQTHEGRFLVRAEMPGVSVEDIEISVLDQTLTLKGRRKRNQELEVGASLWHSEMRFGRFYRRFRLPHRVDSDQIKAHMDRGLLEIELPLASYQAAPIIVEEPINLREPYLKEDEMIIADAVSQ